MRKKLLLLMVVISPTLFANKYAQQAASQEKNTLTEIYTPCEQQTGQHAWPYENYTTLGPLLPCSSSDSETCTQLRPIDENPYTLFSYNACQHVAYIYGGSNYWTGCEIPAYVHNFLVKNDFSAEKIPAMFLRCSNFNKDIPASPHKNQKKCINRSDLTTWPNNQYNILGKLTANPVGHPIGKSATPYYFNECEAVIYQKSSTGSGMYWTDCLPMSNTEHDYHGSINPINFQCSNNPAEINN